jgi:hypothetical protein
MMCWWGRTQKRGSRKKNNQDERANYDCAWVGALPSKTPISSRSLVESE